MVHCNENETSASSSAHIVFRHGLRLKTSIVVLVMTIAKISPKKGLSWNYYKTQLHSVRYTDRKDIFSFTELKTKKY